MKLSKEELDEVVEERTQAVKLRTREVALNQARWYLEKHKEDATPEDLVAMAWTFEKYLTHSANGGPK